MSTAVPGAPWITGVSLLLILFRAAFAVAAPTITANPNPVVISFIAQSGTTTIQWNAEEDHPLAQLWLQVDGTSEILFDQNHIGTKTLTVFPGKVYVLRLWTYNKSEQLASLTVTVKKEPFKVPDGLPIDFIKNVVVEPHGTFVRITFSTKSDSLPVALVSLKEPINFPSVSAKDEAMWGAPTDVLRTAFALPGTNHDATLSSLEPNTLHHYVLSAYDKQHKLWFKKKGSFTTLKRAVTVTFEKVKVTDDSDDLSPGDLVFAFRINGNLSPNGKDLTFGGNISTDETKNINLQATILNPGPTIKINVVGYDDDETEWIPIGPFIMLLLNSCGKGAISEKEGSGETDCGEWTGKSGSYSTTILADGADPNAPVITTFTLTANPVEDDSELAFRVTGKYTITYVQ